MLIEAPVSRTIAQKSLISCDLDIQLLLNPAERSPTFEGSVVEGLSSRNLATSPPPVISLVLWHSLGCLMNDKPVYSLFLYLYLLSYFLMLFPPESSPHGRVFWHPAKSNCASTPGCFSEIRRTLNLSDLHGSCSLL